MSSKKTTKLKTKTKEEVKEKPLESIYKNFEDRDIALLRAHEEASDYVKLELICLEWRVASFSIVVRTNTPLHTIRRHILERFPGADHLCLYRTSDMKKEPLSLQLTLADVGFTGGFRESHMTASLCFNFQSTCRDPLLKSSRILSLASDVMPTSQVTPQIPKELTTALTIGSSVDYLTAAAMSSAAVAASASAQVQAQASSFGPGHSSLLSSSNTVALAASEEAAAAAAAADAASNAAAQAQAAGEPITYSFTRNLVGSVTYTNGIL